MNSLRIGQELRQLIFKKKLGGGEFTYVSKRSGEERQGGKDILDLLKQENDDWSSFENLCKGKNEKEVDFMKKVKKQLKFLPFGTDADLLKNSTPKEVLPQANEKSASSSFSSSANPESNNSSNGTGGYLDEEKDDIEAVSVVVENMDVDVKMAELSKPVKDVTDAIVPNSQSMETIEEPPFKKFCLKPLNSLTTDQVNKDGSENDKNKENVGDDDNICDKKNDLENNSIKYAPNKEDSAVAVEIECITNELDGDVKDDRIIFRLANHSPVPNRQESVMVEEESISSDFEAKEGGEYGKAHEYRRVLVFKMNSTWPEEECKVFFSSIPEVEHVERSKKVYILTFNSDAAALEFTSKQFKWREKDIAMDTCLLAEYKKEKYFQRQFQSCGTILKRHNEMMEVLRDIKPKLSQCVTVQIHKTDLTDEEVQDYFCGFESDFVTGFDKIVEEARKIEQIKKTLFSEYVLVFEEQVDAELFVRSPEHHKFGDVKMKVLLLSDIMKRIRFSQKSKNYVDDKQFTDSDNLRRIAVQTVNKEMPGEEIEVGLRALLPGVSFAPGSVHRCEINNHFWGLYLLTFDTAELAVAATRLDLSSEQQLIKNPFLVSLADYLKYRHMFLTGGCPNRRRETRGGESQSSESWKQQFDNITEVHKEHWGDLTKSSNDNEEKEGIDYQGDLTSSNDKEEKEGIDYQSRGLNGSGTGDGTKYWISCEGFQGTDCQQDIEKYFDDNHENVEETRRFKSSILVRFQDEQSANNYLTLNYVRFKGRKICAVKVDSLSEELSQEDWKLLRKAIG